MFGRELVKSAEMIMGEIEDIHVLPLTLETSVDEYRDAMKSKLASLPKEPIILADLFGGTPFNTAVMLSREYPFHWVTGLNLPMLIDCVQLREEMGSRELCAELVENAGEGIHTDISIS